MAQESESFEVTVKAVTAKAVLLAFVDADVEHWVPLSCIDLDETDVEFERGAEGTIAIHAWFCEKEGLS